MKIKCMAIDDEPLALEQIGSYVQRTPFLELIATCKNAYEALDILKEKEVDLMFIDIDMPDISGLDLVKSLVKKPQIIFTTAYSEYAFEGFQVDAIDYLLKPINYAAFLKAANKSKIWFEANSPEKAEQQPKSDRKEIFVKSNYKVVRILLADISYIESANEYIKIILDNQEVITTFMRLKNIEELLPAGDFMRVHKSFIINLNKILAVDRNRIFIDKKKHIPVGEQYKEIFNKYMDDIFLNTK